MTKRWAIKVELTYDISPGDIKFRYEGDTETDYANRSLERVRPDLEKLLRESQFAHYHISEMPKQVWD